MAYVAANTNVDSGLVARVSGFFAGLRDHQRRYRVYRQTISELNMLSDRDLSDVGIHRSSIEQIAVEAAYGK